MLPLGRLVPAAASMPAFPALPFGNLGCALSFIIPPHFLVVDDAFEIGQMLLPLIFFLFFMTLTRGVYIL